MASRALARGLASSSLSETMKVSPRLLLPRSLPRTSLLLRLPRSQRKDPRTATTGPPRNYRPLGLSGLFHTSASTSRVLRGKNRSPLGVVDDDDEDFKMHLNMPGFSKNEVTVAVEDRELIIDGYTSASDWEFINQLEWSAQNFDSYRFRIKLPDSVRVDGIKAEMKDGVLSIVAPKSEQARTRGFEVRVE